ncbi:MAG: hypothetical protein Q8S13_10625 [Dehalococcoidia bacterium]|nr:hypothetical protein [Dehalococcoidia bacterium]
MASEVLAVLDWVMVGIVGALGLALAIVVLCGAARFLVVTVRSLKDGR